MKASKDELIPSEDAEQVAVVQELEARGIPYWHTNNEIWTSSWKQKARAKAMGTQSGIPDLFVCFPGQLVGIEMKRRKGGVVSPNQKYWAAIIEQCNIPVWVAHGYDEAMEIVEKYEALGKIKLPELEIKMKFAEPKKKSQKKAEDIF